MAQLFSLGCKASPEVFWSDFAAEFFGGSVFGSEAAGEPVPVDSSPDSFWFELAAVGWLALKRSSRWFRAASKMQPMGLRFTGFIESWIFCCLTSRRSQPPLALSVYREVAGWRISRVGGGSAFYVRHHSHL